MTRSWCNASFELSDKCHDLVTIFRHYSFLESAARLHAAVHSIPFTSEVWRGWGGGGGGGGGPKQY